MAAPFELNRAKVVDANFTRFVERGNFPVARTNTSAKDSGLDEKTYLALFHSQLVSRHLDLKARELKENNQGFYTIGSSGHEGNAAIAAAFCYTDLAFLHYRSGAFITQRAKQNPTTDFIYDQLLSLVASSLDPISGGRHKVFGSVELFIPPQTSTIGSHCPKALGAALSITQAKTLKLDAKIIKLPVDSVVLCSFGDASLNHSTVQGALNAACWTRSHQVPLPLVWICEDNGWGISVPTMPTWIEDTIQCRPWVQYLSCDGTNLHDVYKTAKKAELLARKRHQFVFLHMKTVRLLGHAGSDIEFQYRNLEDIETTERDDPLLHTARTLLESGYLSASEIIEQYEMVRKIVNQKAEQACLQPKLVTKAEIMAPIIPPEVKDKEFKLPSEQDRELILGKAYLQLHQPRNMGQCINYALTDIMLQYPQAMIFGEDVAIKGGVYQVTRDLQKRFGQARVFDTLLDEQTILGTAIGVAHNGFLPIPEIQFLAYLVNAFDQVRGEAATLSYFSKGQFTNPMVVRVASFAYQKGFGGHFHNDNAIGFLREIPGIVVVCPSNGREAALLLRKAVELAVCQQRVVIFLEPIALYMTKDLHQVGDNLALCKYPQLEESISFNQVAIEGEGENLAIISYGNGYFLSRQAAKVLQEKHKIDTKLIDLRWLHPLPIASLLQAIKDCKNILIIDEGRKSGSISEAVITALYEHNLKDRNIIRLTGEDCFIPIGEAWQAILPSKAMIVDTAVKMIK